MKLANLKKCMSEPKQVLRLISVIICVCLASYQLSECFRKILRPPISTRYSFYLNQTITLPCVSICRNPSFKNVSKFGITDPYMTSAWRNFKFGQFSLEEFFEEGTYTLDDFIPDFSFDGNISFFELKSFYTLTHGRCYTFSPKNNTYSYSRNANYTFHLQHTEEKKERTSFSNRNVFGFHVYIHEESEMFSDDISQVNSFMDYLFVESGDEIIVTLGPKEYTQLPNLENKCVDQHNYSKTSCQESCIHKAITKKVGCSTPWLRNDLKLPECWNYTKIREIIQLYRYTGGYTDENHQCFCKRSCNITINSAYVQNRRDLATKDKALLTIYFDSNLVTSLNEVLGYDWNLFLADLGGSLGFLLGLSVVGMVATLGDALADSAIKRTKSNEGNSSKEENTKA